MNIFKKIKKSRPIILVLIFICIIFGVFIINSKLVFAADTNIISGAGKILSGTVGEAIAIVVGFIALLFNAAIGLLITLLVSILVSVAKFQNIIGVPAVEKGWVIIRDLCNMFFILILLVIAFATILRQENYSAKRLLPKLLIMAVLINFSKTIFGLIIDFAQVIMLTFVNGFAQNGAAKFVTMFNVADLLSIEKFKQQGGVVQASALTTWSTIVAIILGMIASVITLIVVAVMLAVLVVRVVMLWVYTILSPLVFLGFAFPPIQKYTAKIWEDFIKQVIVGPVLAFFLWLALLTASESSNELSLSAIKDEDLRGRAQQENICAGASAFFCDTKFQAYIISIALLIGGLMVTQQMGGAAASIAGKGMQWAKRAPVLMGKGALAGGGWLGRKIKARTGLELRPTKIIQGFRETLKDKAEEEEVMGESKAGAALKEGKLWGALGASRDFSEAAARGFLWRRGWLGKKSVMAQTRKKGKTIKELEKLEKEAQIEKLPEKREELNKQIEIKNKELESYRTPETYYADAKRNTLARDKMKNFYDNDNEEYLHRVMMNAIEDDQKDIAMAVVLHMAKVYHDNEAVELTPALEDVKDEFGNVVTKKGDNLIADQNGVRALFEQYFIGKLGMAPQEAYSIMSQFQTLSKATNHYGMSEGIGVKNGMLVPRKASEQQRRAAGEARKRDAERNLRDFNRLGHGAEKQFKNEFGETDRVSINNELTEQNFINMMPAMDIEIQKRGRLNPNALENYYKNFLYHKMAEAEPEKIPDLFPKGDIGTLADIAKNLPEFVDTEGKKKSPLQLAYETLYRGEIIYNSREAVDRMKIKESELTDEQKQLWADRDKYHALVKKEIEDALTKFGSTIMEEEKEEGEDKKESKKSKKKSKKKIKEIDLSAGY